MGRWGGTGPDSGAEGPLRGSARRVGDGTGGAERGAGLALSVLPFLPDPLQAHRHPAQGAEPGPGDPGGGRPAALPPSRLSILRPQFVAEERGLTPAQRGTAPAPGHAVSPPGHGHPERAAAELERLVSRRLPHPPAGGGGRSGTAVRVFNSPLGREMASAPCAAGNSNFPCCCRRREFCPGLEPGEEVLLQGVVDAWFETLEGITVVDFKSDRVSRSGAAARGEEYRPQLEAYSRALEEITGKQVFRKALWFFEPGELILL